MVITGWGRGEALEIGMGIDVVVVVEAPQVTKRNKARKEQENLFY